MTEDDVRRIVREELASLGGHLLGKYGDVIVNPADVHRAVPPATLATLGGYLLAEYGKEDEA